MSEQTEPAKPEMLRVAEGLGDDAGEYLLWDGTHYLREDGVRAPMSHEAVVGSCADVLRNGTWRLLVPDWLHRAKARPTTIAGGQVGDFTAEQRESLGNIALGAAKAEPQRVIVPEPPIDPRITSAYVIVSTNCDGGRHHGVYGDRYFFEGGDDDGYEEIEDAENALTKMDAKPNEAMIARDAAGVDRSEWRDTVRGLLAEPAARPVRSPLQTVAPMERMAGSTKWGAV